MNLKTKIILLTVLPLLFLASLLALINMNQLHELSDQEIKTFEENLLASKKRELKNYITLALTSIDHIVQNPSIDKITAREQIKKILNELTYGEDGYFFVYDQQGINLVHPILNKLVGKNLFDLKDSHGNYVIRELLKLAAQGGGFHRYHWNKPSTGTDAEKLSYVVQVPVLNWMIGSGLYIDDISAEVAKIRTQVDNNIQTTFITILLVTIFLVVLIILLGVYINLHQSKLADARLRALAHKSVRFQVAERRRFARELHDGINQLMVSIKFRIESAIHKIQNKQDNANLDLEQSILVINDTIQEVRRISHDLRPGLLDDMGLEIALENLLKQFSERTDNKIVSNILIDNANLTDDIEITIYRVIQEALSNIEKHSGTCCVTIKLFQRLQETKLIIKDDGCGFNTLNLSSNEGIGLRNMRERVELLGGIFSLKSDHHLGTKITAILPNEVFINE